MTGGLMVRLEAIAAFFVGGMHRALKTIFLEGV